MDKQKIILVTDFGGDVDDAHALHMLLYFWADKVDLLGIVTTCGMTQLRPRLVDVFLKIASRDIPVIPGRSRPLGTSSAEALPGTPFYPFWIEGEGVLENNKALIQDATDEDYATAPEEFARLWGNCVQHDAGGYGDSVLARGIEEVLQKSHEFDASDFIIKMAREHPRAVKIVAIGALTDVAIALHRAPDMKDLLEEVVFMGMMNNHSPQYRYPPGTPARMGMNTKQDMVAAAVVAESGVRLTCVPSEQTRTFLDFGVGGGRPPVSQCPALERLLSTNDLMCKEESLGTPAPGAATKQLAVCTASWYRKARWCGLADPLTVAVALEPDRWGTYSCGHFGVHLGDLTTDFALNDVGHHRALCLSTESASHFAEEFSRAFTENWNK